MTKKSGVAVVIPGDRGKNKLSQRGPKFVFERSQRVLMPLSLFTAFLGKTRIPMSMCQYTKEGKLIFGLEKRIASPYIQLKKLSAHGTYFKEMFLEWKNTILIDLTMTSLVRNMVASRPGQTQDFTLLAHVINMIRIQTNKGKIGPGPGKTNPPLIKMWKDSWKAYGAPFTSVSPSKLFGLGEKV